MDMELDQYDVWFAQNRGGRLRRFLQWLRPHGFAWLAVTVRRYGEEAEIPVEEKNIQLPLGEYQLAFYDEDGQCVGRKDLSIREETPLIIPVVYSYFKRLTLLSMEIVGYKTFDEMSAQHRLMKPRRFDQ